MKSARNTAYYERNRERIIARVREYAKRHPEKRTAWVQANRVRLSEKERLRRRALAEARPAPTCLLCRVEVPRRSGRGRQSRFCSDEHRHQWGARRNTSTK